MDRLLSVREIASEWLREILLHVLPERLTRFGLPEETSSTLHQQILKLEAELRRNYGEVAVRDLWAAAARRIEEGS
jgi:hypothetical protein